MKATVREYTVKKKVVVVEIDETEAKDILDFEGLSVRREEELLKMLHDALDADRAEEQRKESEDVPF
jgi:hypothetical protein